MKEIPADLTLISGGSINGFENKQLTKAHGLKPYEFNGSCKGCALLEGTLCILHAAEGRHKIERIMDRQETIPNTVQALVTRGEMPISRLSGREARYQPNCRRNFVTGTFELPHEDVVVESQFYRDRREAPWREAFGEENDF